MKLHHIGIATDDAERGADRYQSLFGIPVVHSEEFDGLLIIFLDLGNGYLELLEPISNGPVGRFLETRGPGIHHIAVTTEDISTTIDRLSEADFELIDSEPRTGAWGHRVAFVHPDSTDGVLIEFVEVH